MRLPHIQRWLQQNDVTALALQETKLQDHEFPVLDFKGLGYDSVFSGQKAYNGVAWLSRSPAKDIVTHVDGTDQAQKRVIAATIAGLRVINLYVINGKDVGHEDYQLKLAWLTTITDFIAAEMKRHPYLLVVGDFNITPDDDDVYDPTKWHEKILCSTPERQALERMFAIGLIDSFRLFDHPVNECFSWWHYRQGAFERNHGLRIDLVLASRALAEQCIASVIDRTPRGWDRPSDHAPVLATFKTPLPP